jgi:hypothetical protein
MVELPNSVIMAANSDCYLHIRASKTAGFRDDITERNSRQTGNAAGAFVIMRGIGLWDNASWNLGCGAG